MTDAKTGLFLLAGAGAALLVAGAGRTFQASSNPTGSKSGTGGGGGVAVSVPATGGTTGGTTGKPAPVVGVPAGPDWGAQVAPGRLGGDAHALAAHIAKRRPLTLPYRDERLLLAAALVRVAQTEAYPLDLLTGHAIAEGGGRLCMRPTAGSKAYGPLQTTAAACAAVGAAYPPPTIEEALRAGVRYMRLMRRTYPTEAVNLTATLRVYGMGIGNYRSFLKYGCAGAAARPVSVWRAECAPTTYTGKIHAEMVAAAAAGFHTVPLSAWEK